MKYIYLLIGLYCLWACDDVTMEPYATDGEAPGQVTDVVVKPTPGGAEISYMLPSDMDLLYVEAQYTLPNGENVRMNASGNTRIMIVEGFAEVKEYDVALTCVDRSGNRSEPYMVKVTPDTPPVIAVFNTLKVQPDFGGLNLQWDNPTEADLAILIYMKNEEGEFENIDTYYTSSKNGNYSVRGLEDVESEFFIQVRDKWNNYSEKLTESLTPMYEQQIPSSDLKVMEFVYMENLAMSEMSFLPRMWDENFEDNINQTSVVPWSASITVSPIPIRLSRIIIWQYAWPFNNYGHYYAGGNGSLYEIYGTDKDVPSTDMSDWTLLLTCPISKPSGLPIGIGRDNMSDEDYDLAHNKGHEFVLPLDAPAVRHLRIRAVDCFETVLGTFSELQIFGAVSKNE